MNSAVFEAIFKDDRQALKALLTDADRQQVFRGQSPLSFAITLGRKECVELLLANPGTNVLAKNSQLWSPFNEAVSMGDRDIVRMVYMARRAQLDKWFQEKGAKLLQELSSDLHDFTLDMTWKFQSWIPFVSALCPSDTYKIYKRGTSVRIDTTLVGFEQLTWIRGNVSIIFKELPDGPRLVICDRERRLVQQIYPMKDHIQEDDIQEEINIALNTKIMAPPLLDFDSCKLTRLQTGWVFKTPRTERIGAYDTTVWQLDNMSLNWKTRSEHLLADSSDNEKPEEKLHFVVANPEASADSEAAVSAAQEAAASTKRLAQGMKKFTPSLKPPPSPECRGLDFASIFPNQMQMGDDSKSKGNGPDVEMVEGDHTDALLQGDLNAEGGYLHLGRPMVEQTTRRSVQATLWMHSASQHLDSGTSIPSIQSPSFPLSLASVRPLLDLIGMGSHAHVDSLSEFFNAKLPDGFPVQIELPLGFFPLSALVTFGNVSVSSDFSQDDGDLFHIPGKADRYREGEVIPSSVY